jgi:hypothetical protein
MPTITDDFNRASLGTNWGAMTAYGTMAIDSSTVLIPGGLSNDRGAKYVTKVLTHADQYVQADITINTSNSTNSAWLLFRMPGGATVDGYFVAMPRYGGERQICKIVANAVTVLAQESDGTPTGTRRLRGEVEGSTLRLLIDGIEELSTTDASISADNRYVGVVGYYEATGRWHLDNFEAGDLAVATFPTIEAVAESSVNTAGTSHAVTLPSDIGTSDIVLIIMDIGSTSATLNALTGWGELLDEAVANGLKILWYTGPGIPTTPTFTSSASTRSASIAFRISGADRSVTPQIGTTATGTSATPDPPASATPPSTKNYLFITFFGQAGEEADDDTWVNSPPADFLPPTPYQKACGTAGTNLGGKIGAAWRQLNTGAAQNPGTFGVDVSAAWRAQTIIVHPMPLAPPVYPTLPTRLAY